MQNNNKLPALLLTLITVSGFVFSSPALSEPSAERPRIGLVLGGGGARGAAHVGVLKVLEELRIPVDYVVGTSMGSVVGGLYASGMSAEQIKQEMLNMDWDDVFNDDPDRRNLSFRRKHDDLLYMYGLKPGFNDGQIQLPLAFVHGQKFDLELNRLTLPVFDTRDFNQLPIPYRAIACDLETGEEVVLGGGSLARAIRASMAVPAVFDPVEINGRLLVDGGLANNVPVSAARDMGADVFIVVDVGSGLSTREDLTGGLAVTGQLAGFLFSLNTEQQLASLTDKDVLIRPDLGDIGGGSFNRVSDAMPIGEASARKAIETLRRYSLSEEDYQQHVATRLKRTPASTFIDAIRIENNSTIDNDVIAVRISAQPGKPLDLERLEEDIGDVYGLDLFESVRYELIKENGQNVLVILVKEKSWGPGYVQLGLQTSNNLQGDTNFSFSLLHSLTAINSLNGEWRTGLQFGDEPNIFTEIHQPLDPKSRYFVAGKLGFGSRNINQFTNDGDLLRRYQLTSSRLELSAGREFGTWGEGRFGYRRGSGEANVTIGESAPDIDVDRGESFFRLSLDELDNPRFPRHGQMGSLEVRAARKDMGASADYNQMQLNFLQVFPWGENTLIGSILAGITEDDNAPIEALYRIGGLFRLSGLQENQFSGQHTGLLSLIYMRRTKNLTLFRSYVGASLELGNVWQSTDDINADNSITAGSVFLAMDTPIGQFYVAYGRTDTDQSSVHIYLSPRFAGM